jgi:ribosome-associated translation inhibitor RaiA
MAAKKNTKTLGSRNGSAKDLGRTDAADTPLEVHTQGLKVRDALVDHVQEKLGARLGKYALHIDRVTVRFEDLNGPRGGVDTECRVQVMIPSRPTIVVTERATDAWRAFDGVCKSLTRAVKRDLDRSGHSVGKGIGRQRAVARAKATAAAREPNPPPENGSLIGRRVGRSAANLAAAAERPTKKRGDAWVDTAQSGVSATDKRAGGGSTARRNTKGKTPRSVAALEDSAQPRPSRTSTRKSANHTKSGEGLAERAVSRAHSPSQRASAAKARSRR